MPEDSRDPASAGASILSAQTALTTRLFGLVQRAQKILERGGKLGPPVPGGGEEWQQAFLTMLQAWFSNPFRAMEAQIDLWRRNVELVLSCADRDGQGTGGLPGVGDKRFSDSSWSEELAFDYIRRSYLLMANWLEGQVLNLDLDPETKERARFIVRQYVDAISPSNFVTLNPMVLRETVATHGENLVRGLENFVNDLERGNGRLAIRMVDEKAFTVGENIATTPGKVVFRNFLFELIQYSPTTEKVHTRPVLIVPPWINKYYVLDLKPNKSFIRWAVEQGHTVFVISWVNPDPGMAQTSFEDYVVHGFCKALDAVSDAAGPCRINTVGYCIGGTLLAAALAACQDDRVASATFLATLVDFSEPGELKLFISDSQIRALEAELDQTGCLPGHKMADVFSLLRDNDLIWSFHVNNYLLGRPPAPFDILYWNADSTNLPAGMLRYYLRNMYLENRLVQPGGLTIAGTPVDLRKIVVPVYQVSTEADHIVPWRATTALSRLAGGSCRFVLGGSGHIAGIINPPEAGRYHYFVNDSLPLDPDEWKAGAQRHPGSWWPDWDKWVSASDEGMIPARHPGDGKLTPLEDAPGSYVRVRVEG